MDRRDFVLGMGILPMLPAFVDGASAAEPSSVPPASSRLKIGMLVYPEHDSARSGRTSDDVFHFAGGCAAGLEGQAAGCHGCRHPDYCQQHLRKLSCGSRRAFRSGRPGRVSRLHERHRSFCSNTIPNRLFHRAVLRELGPQQRTRFCSDEPKLSRRRGRPRRRPEKGWVSKHSGINMLFWKRGARSLIF
jgi:hypothetical protein